MRQLAHRAPRRALKFALTLGVAGLASLAFAGVAGANVIVVAPDVVGSTDNLTAAINQANTNSASSNTIVLETGVYEPATEPITISKNLSIVADHSVQATDATKAGAADINGSRAAANSVNNLFVVSPNVTFNLSGIGCDACGAGGFAAILDNGTVNESGVNFLGGEGFALNVSGVGKATISESNIQNLSDAISLQGGSTASSLTLNNVSIDQGGGNGIDIGNPSYTLNMNNTLMAFQVGPECSGGTASNGGPGSLDDDGTCGVQFSDNTAVDSLYPINPNTNGGPTLTAQPAANNGITTNMGVNCPTDDQRFFANPVVGGVTKCDIGSSTTSGTTRQTTPPQCSVLSTNEGTTPATQTVGLSDSITGIGDQPGAGTDNPSNTVSTTYPPVATPAVSVLDSSVSNLQISNGTVAFTPLAWGSQVLGTNTGTNPTPSLTLTASKTTAGQTTQWSFTGMNVAGIAKACF